MKQSIFSLCCGMDCLPWSLSSGAHSRHPLARNDGLKGCSKFEFEERRVKTSPRLFCGDDCCHVRGKM